MFRIPQPVPEHLVSAADAHHHAAPARVANDRGVHAAVAKVDQVFNRVFGSRQQDQVGAFQILRVFRIVQPASRLQRQRLEIREIGDMAQLHHRHVDISRSALPAETLRNAVLIFQFHVHPGHHAEHGNMNPFLQHPQPRLQDFHIPAELVDDDALDPSPFLFRQQHHRAQQGSEHAAQVDIPHQDYRSVGSLCHAHVDDVAFPQVNLRRAAGAFDHDAVGFFCQRIIDLFDSLPQSRFVPVIFHGRHVADDFSLDDYLALPVAGGFQQHRIHPDVRFNARRLGLGHLGPAHFQSVPGDKGIQGHVLRLERHGFPSVLFHNPQKGAAKHAFPDG